VSDIAHMFGVCHIWAECLETCGYQIEEVHHRPRVDLGLSSAVDSPYAMNSNMHTPKLSFADYLQQRKKFSAVTEICDYDEDAENAHIQEELQKIAEWNEYQAALRDKQQRREDAWKWDEGSINGSDTHNEGTSTKEDDDTDDHGPGAAEGSDPKAKCD